MNLARFCTPLAAERAMLLGAAIRDRRLRPHEAAEYLHVDPAALQAHLAILPPVPRWADGLEGVPPELVDRAIASGGFMLGAGAEEMTLAWHPKDRTVS